MTRALAKALDMASARTLSKALARALAKALAKASLHLSSAVLAPDASSYSLEQGPPQLAKPVGMLAERESLIFEIVCKEVKEEALWP